MPFSIKVPTFVEVFQLSDVQWMLDASKRPIHVRSEIADIAVDAAAAADTSRIHMRRRAGNGVGTWQRRAGEGAASEGAVCCNCASIRCRRLPPKYRKGIPG